MSLSAIPKTLRDLVFKRDCGLCRYCRLCQVGQASVFHINHIIPRSRLGGTHEANLALQCPHCSLHKADAIDAVDPTSGVTVSLFHPLRDRWPEHFRILEDGTCEGLSPVGRATAWRLHMNDPLPRIARAIQIELGLIHLNA